MKIVYKIIFAFILCLVFLLSKNTFTHHASAATNTLYGVGSIFDISTHTFLHQGLLSIDPATNSVTPTGGDIRTLGTNPNVENPSAFDPIGHRYFTYAHNDNGDFFITYNTQTGTLSSVQINQGTITTRAASLQYDTNTNTLYGIGLVFDSSTKTYNYIGLLTIDPATNAVTPIGDDLRTLGANPHVDGASAYDPIGHRYFSYVNNDNGNFLVTYNTQTGSLSAVPTDQEPIFVRPTSLQYDTNTGTLYSIGSIFDLSTHTFLHQGLLTIDPTTFTATPIGDDLRTLGTNPNVENPSAFDPIGHRYFTYAHNDNGDFFITYNTQTGTFSSVQINQGTITTRAASLQYDAGVANTAASVDLVTINPNPAQTNVSVNATAPFTDPDISDTHTATIDWGDGINTNQSCSVTEPIGSTPGSISCTLASGYPTANVYPVVITVSDGTDISTSPTTYASVYEPVQGSIFSAGQRFSNPTTAYPNTNGNVTFGLSYKYQGGMPQSIRQFSMDFNAANIHFNATTVSSLIVSNGIATLVGTGTLNGQGTYNFFVTGSDGGGIRIQITDSANTVIYDTQPGDPITATPTTSVTGRVVVH